MCDYGGKKALVCGMASSGIPAARLLNKLGASVIISDLKVYDKIDAEAKELEMEGIMLFTGKNPDEIVAMQDVIVLSPGIPCDLPFIDLAKKLRIPVIGEIELAYSQYKGQVIAITGTNGKTTTTTIIGQIMKACNYETEVVGNIGVAFSDKVLRLGSDSYAVVELSSFQLESIKDFRPKISAVLNITPDHLNRHKTLENYVAIKERIFENQIWGDYAVLNYDNKLCLDMAERCIAEKIFFSAKTELDEGVFLRDGYIWLKAFGYDCALVDAGKLNIFVENALAAAAIALCAKVPLDILRQTLINFVAVEHRIEYVTEIKGVTYYNDSKGTNPDAAIKAIESMKRPIILIGGGYDKDSDFSDWVKFFGDRVRHLIVLGRTADKIIETCKAYNYNEFTKVNSLRDAVLFAGGKATEGDCVLLSPACASWDMFDNYEQRGKLFKDFVMELKNMESREVNNDEKSRDGASYGESYRASYGIEGCL